MPNAACETLVIFQPHTCRRRLLELINDAIECWHALPGGYMVPQFRISSLHSVRYVLAQSETSRTQLLERMNCSSHELWKQTAFSETKPANLDCAVLTHVSVVGHFLHPMFAFVILCIH